MAGRYRVGGGQLSDLLEVLGVLDAGVGVGRRRVEVVVALEEGRLVSGEGGGAVEDALKVEGLLERSRGRGDEVLGVLGK